MQDIIESGVTDFVIPAFDEKEYARKLDRLMCDEELRLRMAKKGKESTKRFEPKVIAQKWIELFQGL